MAALLVLLPAVAPAAEPQVAFTFADPRIDESSGLVSASRSDVLFTHNDSGDDARFFAVGPDGATRTVYALPGVQARDWEDMARGPDEEGRSSLWLGDIGDNDTRRDLGVLVHRVREPVPGTATTVTTEAPTSFRLRYEDGPRDAEALLVHPRTGRLLIVSKAFTGGPVVYAAPAALDPSGPNLLTRVAEIDLAPTGTPGGPTGIGGLGQILVTAGDIAPDGTRVALRTYTDLYEWTVDGDDVAGAFAGKPTVTPLPDTRQGEGLAYSSDGQSLLTSSEGVGSPVHRVPAAATGAGAGGSPGAGPGRPAAEPPRAVDRTERGFTLPGWVVPAAAAAVLAGAVWLIPRRRRREHR